MLIPLKKKYLTPHGGTGGKYKGRTGNSNGRKKYQSIAALLNAAVRKRGK